MPLNFFALLSLIGCLISIYIANYVYYKNPYHLENRLFAYLSVLIAYWGFTEFQWRSSATVAEAILWEDFNSLWPFAVMTLFHLVLVMINQHKSKFWKIMLPFLYGTAVVVSLIDFFIITPSEAAPVFWGWRSVMTEAETAQSLITESWAALLAIISTVMSLVYYHRLKAGREKNQMLYFSIGIVLITSIGVVTEVILQEILPNGFVGLVVFAFILGDLVIGYAIIKYELFVLTPEKVALEIISTMSDALFLVNHDYKIESTNKASLKLLGYEEKELLGLPIGRVFVKDDTNPIELVFNRKQIHDEVCLLNKKDGNEVLVSISSSRLYDRSNSPLGVVLIVRDMTEREKEHMQIVKMDEKLKKQNKELEQMNQLMIGRELKMKELKEQLKKSDENQ